MGKQVLRYICPCQTLYIKQKPSKLSQQDADNLESAFKGKKKKKEDNTKASLEKLLFLPVISSNLLQ